MQTVNSINNPYITPIINSNISSSSIVLQTPGYSHSLTPIPKNTENLNEIAVNFILAMSKPLMVFEQIRIMNGNLKPSNIFFNDEGEVVLTDYCLNDLRSVKDFTTDCSYYSPEVLYNGIINEKSDIFSFGCILYYMLSGGNRLFHNTSARSIIDIENLKVNKELKNLLKRMLEYDKEMRINLNEIINESSKMNSINYIFDFHLYHDIIFKVHNDLELIEIDENDTEIDDREYDSEMRSMMWKIIEIYNESMDVKCLSYVINVIWQNYSYSLWQILITSFKFHKIAYRCDGGGKYLLDSLILNSIKDGYMLQLSNKCLDDSVIFSSSYILRNLRLLQRFDYSHNSLTDDGLIHFCGISTSFLELISLDISFNLITSKSMEVFSNTLSSLTDLKSLRISNNLIGDVGCMILSNYYNILINNEINSLNLSGMELTDSFMCFLSRNLKYLSMLETLDLSQNQITDYGINLLKKEMDKIGIYNKLNVILFYLC